MIFALQQIRIICNARQTKQTQSREENRSGDGCLNLEGDAFGLSLPFSFSTLIGSRVGSGGSAVAARLLPFVT